MHRLALRSLVLAASLLLITSACDKGEPKADGGKKAEVIAADEPKVDGEQADGAEAGEQVAAAEAGAAEAGAAEAGAAEAGEQVAAAQAGAEGDEGEAAAEAGEEVAAADAGEEDGGDKPADADDKAEKKPPADKAPAVAKIDGKPLFEAKCKSCHGIDGKGDTTIGKKVEIPSLVKTKLSKAKVVTNITNGVPDTKMKAYKDKLSKDEIDAIATYVKKL